MKRRSFLAGIIGLPIVATFVSGTKRVVRECRGWIMPDDAEELARRVELLQTGRAAPIKQAAFDASVRRRVSDLRAEAERTRISKAEMHFREHVQPAWEERRWRIRGSGTVHSGYAAWRGRI